MMKKHLFLLWAFIGMLVFNACSDDDEKFANPIGVTIESETGRFHVLPDQKLTLSAKVDNAEGMTYRWTVDGKEVSTASTYEFSGSELRDYKVELSVAQNGNQGLSEAEIEVHGKYKYGTFVLNEKSFLNFIDEDGNLADSVFYRENGEKLANLTQDLYIHDDHLYIVSQQGSNYTEPGRLYVTNAETLKKEAMYDLTGLSTPSHLAVPDNDYVYVRTPNGIYLFRPSTQALTKVEGSDGAIKHPMAVVDDKVLALAGKNLLVIEEGQTKVAKSIEFSDNVTGVLKAGDDHAWVACASGEICKLNLKDYSKESHMLPEEVKPALSISMEIPTGSNITAKGDTLYMNGVKLNVYRHIFSKGEKDLTLVADLKTFFPAATQTYNPVAVHPVTGDLYANISEGVWGGLPYHTAIFSVNGDNLELKKDFQDVVNYPAGIFFTYNFD